jgi:DNA helicase-2/ATP-dependent DNA helicase PcrA
VDPAHVLALTFTVRAAGELRGRLRQLGVGQVRASTFHAAALRQLNYFWPRVVGGRPPQLIDSKAGLVREAAKRARVRLDGTGERRRHRRRDREGPVIQVRPDGYPAAAAAAGRSAVAGADNLAAVYAAYEELRRERHLIDFESVLELTAAILIDSRVAAGQVHDIFRHFVVDEYQDVNPLQKLLLEAWLGDRDDLCVVGDPNQVIYSFTGATSTYLTGFTAEFPAATVVRLVRDYRSTPQVVAVANQRHRPRRRPAPARPRPVLIEYPDDAAGGSRAGPSGPDAHDGRGARQGDRHPGPGQRRHRAVRAGAGRSRPALRDPRRRALLRPARGPPGAGAAARGRPGRGGRRFQ